MKKLNKLLMPIVGVSTIAATAIPLVACSKYTNGVEVSEQEWNDAFIYLCATKEGASWKSALEDSFQVYNFRNGTFDGFAEYYNMAFNDNLATMKAVGLDEDGDIEVSELASIAKNNMYFTYIKDAEGKWDGTNIETTSLMQQYLIEMFEYAGGKSEYTFDKDTKSYIFNDTIKIDDKDGYSNATIKFDSNKKITYINYHAVLFDNGSPYIICNTLLHPIYDNVKVEVSNDLIERANKHTLDVTIASKAATVTLPTEDKTDAVMLNMTLDNTYKTITVSDQDKASLGNNLNIDGITVNGAVLDKAKYSINYTTGTITFTDGLAKDAKVSIGLHGVSKATKLNLAFAA